MPSVLYSQISLPFVSTEIPVSPSRSTRLPQAHPRRSRASRRPAHRRRCVSRTSALSHSDFVILHARRGLLLYKVVSSVMRRSRSCISARAGTAEALPRNQKPAAKSSGKQNVLPGDDAPGIIVQAAPPPDCALGDLEMFRQLFHAAVLAHLRETSVSCAAR